MPDVIHMYAVDEPEPAVPPDARPEAEPVGGLTPHLDPLRIPPTLRPGRGAGLREDIEVRLRATWVRLHSQMAPTHVWAYDGHFPGPTFDVRRGQRIRVGWRNGIDSAYPAAAGDAPRVVEGVPSSARAGRGPDFVVDKDVADLPAWTVTHLHGAVTGGGSDGWPENAVPAGDTQLSEYPNDQRAAALWYHDQARHVTRWNVYAGLAGMYLVRDAEEDALHLPRGKYEVPLILMDRNFEVDGRGRPTGELLYKVPRQAGAAAAEAGASGAGSSEARSSGAGRAAVTLPFTGPYTLVNGVLWPYFDAEPRWYRFRLLNAANARVFDLVLIDGDGLPVRGAIKQIGSDGGLLPRPVAVDFDDGLPRLTIAPGERMDLLIDFRALRGRRVRLVNVGPNALPGEADPAGDVPYPPVMEFRVARRPVHDGFVLPGVISSSFRRLPPDTPHTRRLVVLTPPGTAGGGGHPEIWEMAAVADGPVGVAADGVIQLTDAQGRTTTYRRVARGFDDASAFKVTHGEYEQWSFLHLGGPVHPMHIHLSAWQVVRREPYVVTGFDPVLGGTRAGEPVTFDAAPGAAAPPPANELGWKDVFRVRPGELVSVMGLFAGAHGRFVYHSHLLEHGDAGMTRSFVVLPAEVRTFDHHHRHGNGNGGGPRAHRRRQG